MPSGGATPLTDDEMKIVWACYEAAEKNGLVYEWLMWFVGGLSKDNMSPTEAANAAATEWDF